MGLCRAVEVVASPLDERKLKDRAHVLVREGRLAAAVEVYLKLIAENRQDSGLRLRHAELCTRLKRIDPAVASYRVAAHLLVNAGHHAKAHAALNCAMRLAPGDMGLRRALKELHALQEPPPLPLPAPPRSPPRVTLEIAAVVVELGSEEERSTESFVPKWT
jgi:hypothetical protein